MQINVAVTDANNIVCTVVPPQVQTITIDRGVAGNGIVSIVPVTISTFQYLRITYTDGTVSDVGPLTSTAYTATAPINITGNTISLQTVPIASGGTAATTAAAAIQNLLPSYTGNGSKRLGLNSGATALEWVADGGGTVTSVDVSGGTTGLTTSGGPITSSGTITLAGTLAIANGGSGQITAQLAMNAFAGAVTSGSYLRGNGTNVVMATIQAADVPTLNQNTTGTAANITATSNSTLTTLSVLSLPGSQVSGNISGNAANVTGTVAIGNGGTGQITANAAFNALAPSQTGNSGKYLTTDGTNTSWATNPLGTVTSVSGTGTVSGLTLSGTVTTSGSLTLGGTLDLSAYNGAGAFTTLSASSTVTLSGGTANGVAYLNGSKVLTTNSASLLFDGTTLSVGGQGAFANSTFTANTGIAAKTAAASGINPYLQLYNGNASTDLKTWRIGGLTSGALSIETVNDAYTVSSGVMILTNAGNVGIGTSSPGGTLHLVASSANLLLNQYSADALGPAAALAKSRGTTSSPSAVLTGDSLGLFSGGGYNSSSVVYNKAAIQMYAAENWTATANGTYMTFATTAIGATGRTAQMTIDSSGNVGIGATPSAWASGNKFIDVNASASFGAFGSTDSMTLANAYWNGTNWIRKNANNAWRMVMEATSGAPSLTFQYAGSSTAGSTISWSEAMRLDASGQVGIGFTPLSTQGNLQVYKLISGGGPATSGTTDANQVFAVNAGSVQLSYGAYAAGQGWIQQRAGGNFAVNYDLVLQPNGGNLVVGGTSSSGLVTAIRNTGAGYAAAFTAKATGTAQGQLAGYMFMPTFTGTGDNTPRRAADIWGGFVGNWTGEYLAFGVGTGSGNDAGNLTTERMRIDGSGNLLVGTTTAVEKLTVGGNISINTSGNPYLQIKTSGSGNNPFIRLQADTLTWDIQGTFSNAGDELYFLYGGAARSYINSSTGAYVPVSDQRLKKDITDISYGLSSVMALRPVEYLMNAETTGAQKHLGFIAQEAQAVIPNSVSEMTGGMYGMDKTEIVPVLVKAIQEQQALIESLTTRLTALEGKA
jgi:hypothetical protein